MRDGGVPSRVATWRRRTMRAQLVALVARTVRGIEELVAAEVRRSGVGSVDLIGHREVHLSTPDPARAMAALACADDVLLLAGLVDGVGRTKADLQRLGRGLAGVDARRLMRLRQRLGGPAGSAGIDVSASFVGRRTYNRFDIEDTVGHQLARVLGLAYHSRRHGTRPPAGTCSWRVSLEGSRATVGLRIGDRPAHRRAYKQATVAGTLHPPLAAAMVGLAGAAPGDTVLDPCCGAGTLLVEQHHAVPGLRLLGMDCDGTSLRSATANAAGVPVRLVRADAGRLPVADRSVDRILVNPPWGRRVPARGLLAGRPERLWAEARRVLRPGGRLVALLHECEPAPIACQGFSVVTTRAVRVSGASALVVTGT
jgi:tRNA (guanine6-N2)-methyltransferase